MDDKQLINESIKVADVLAKELSFWKRLFIYTCSVLLAILIIFGVLAYIYVYNTETIIETTTQDGFQTQYKGSNNITITTSDITNDNITKVLEGRNGKTND